MQKLKAMLIEHEGKRNFAYQDGGAKWHIGIGRNIDADGGLGLSDEECEYLLDADIVRFTRELAAAFPWFGLLDSVRQEALIMICFNLGLTRLRLFIKALDHLENGKFEESAVEFLDSRWAKQVGHKRSSTLAEMISTGQYPD